MRTKRGTATFVCLYLQAHDSCLRTQLYSNGKRMILVRARAQGSGIMICEEVGALNNTQIGLERMALTNS